jgi:hypothetical protein
MWINKAAAAEGQLHTALSIWFHYGHPVAILALAHGAYECYEALGAHAGRPSPYRDWLGKQPQGFQDRARMMINFIKHGRKKLTGRIPFMPVLAENMLMDAIESYKHLNGKMTPQMKLFVARWAIENPSPGNAAVRPHIINAAKAHDLADRDRTAFLHEGHKRLSTGGQ